MASSREIISLLAEMFICVMSSSSDSPSFSSVAAFHCTSRTSRSFAGWEGGQNPTEDGMPGSLKCWAGGSVGGSSYPLAPPLRATVAQRLRAADDDLENWPQFPHPTPPPHKASWVTLGQSLRPLSALPASSGERKGRQLYALLRLISSLLHAVCVTGVC